MDPDTTTERSEARASSDVLSAEALLPGQEEMQAARRLFQPTGIAGSAQSDRLDFGSMVDLYGRDNLLAQGPASLEQASARFGMPAGKIADVAYKLGHEQPRRWQDAPDGPGKCNIFLDTVLRSSGVKLPWAADKIPSVHTMRLQLEADKAHFDCYKFEPGRTDKAMQQMQPGDIVIWDQTNHYQGLDYPLQHCGVMGRDGIIHYAGSKETNGYNFRPLNDFTSSPFYGSPIAVFRPKNLKYD